MPCLWVCVERFLVRVIRGLSGGDYDGVCFNAEGAVRLAVKAVLTSIWRDVLILFKTTACYTRSGRHAPEPNKQREVPRPTGEQSNPRPHVLRETRRAVPLV